MRADGLLLVSMRSVLATEPRTPEFLGRVPWQQQLRSVVHLGTGASQSESCGCQVDFRCSSDFKSAPVTGWMKYVKVASI